MPDIYTLYIQHGGLGSTIFGTPPKISTIVVGGAEPCSNDGNDGRKVDPPSKERKQN